jgi:hypothetical protein
MIILVSGHCADVEQQLFEKNIEVWPRSKSEPIVQCLKEWCNYCFCSLLQEGFYSVLVLKERDSSIGLT